MLCGCGRKKKKKGRQNDAFSDDDDGYYYAKPVDSKLLRIANRLVRGTPLAKLPANSSSSSRQHVSGLRASSEVIVRPSASNSFASGTSSTSELIKRSKSQDNGIASASYSRSNSVSIIKLDWIVARHLKFVAMSLKFPHCNK